ncbi:methylated-DNA--[protein]-cysteine S-methyltransferase [bacterium]|nr:methylated-DNA--[protein]-cysteine S-methyltransferase [bacterium]
MPAAGPVRYLLTDCTLGRLIVAATPAGVCYAAIVDAPDATIADLRSHFPDATTSADEQISRWADAFARHVEDTTTALAVPLDIQGSDFRKRVWAELQRIPPGTTITYTELARRCGCPESVRAVASACAANLIAVAIPCHRVIRTDGSLSGYRWGIERKRTLIERESRSKQIQGSLFS